MKRRVFIGIFVPEHIKREFQKIYSKLQKFDWPVQWEISDKWHITIRFLGYIDESELEAVFQVVEQAALHTPTFELRCDNFLMLPDLKIPRVICLNVSESNQLTTLHANIAQSLDERGIGECERFPFAAHITIGRTRPLPANFRALIKMKFNAAFSVHSISVVESVLRRSGSEYKTLKNITL